MNTAEDIVNDKNQQILTVSFDDPVHTACEFMVQNKIGAVLVKKDQEYVGVWTERDLLSQITKEGFDPKTAKVGNYMSSPLLTAPHNTPIYKLEEMFLGLFVRHLVVEKEGHYIGFISIGDVLRAGLLQKDREFKKINSLVGWDYYEDWKWGRKRKND